MPTITDATVVAQAYNTSGNGGRKLVRADSGNLYAITKTSTAYFVYKSSDNGNTWTQFTTGTYTSIQDVSLISSGNFVFWLISLNGGALFQGGLVDGKNIGALVNVDSNQTAIGNVSLAINEAKTELHATWASKNSTYPNSFNIRYAKGTINGDGTVTWGAVEQVTNANSGGVDYTEPCLVLTTSKVIIFTNEANGASIKRIRAFQKTSSWDISSISTTVYSGGTYAQSSPSAIFVPQSINGLANGRIWVAWHGRDTPDTSKDNIRISYSDDGGITWSPQDKLTTGNSYNQVNATITVNRNNKVFVIWNGQDATSPTYTNIFKKEYIAGNSTTTTKMTNNTTGDSRNASSINSFDVNFTEPLFIYLDDQNAKVGFYGTWTVTTISVTPGDIGQKTDKNNILSYSITTDGEMSTITEKINGTVVNTRNTTSGQAVQLGLTQAQWDAIRFGKYADATGGKNTLTVEMGSEKWTYTFDKQLASDSDIISASKAVKDANEVYLPVQISRLADVAKGKGAMIPANPKIDDIVDGIKNTPSGRVLSGVVTSSVGTTSYEFLGVNSITSFYNVTVTGLPFRPKRINVKPQNTGASSYVTEYVYGYMSSYQSEQAFIIGIHNAGSTMNTYGFKADKNGLTVTSTGFVLPVFYGQTVYEWTAYEN